MFFGALASMVVVCTVLDRWYICYGTDSDSESSVVDDGSSVLEPEIDTVDTKPQGHVNESFTPNLDELEMATQKGKT